MNRLFLFLFPSLFIAFTLRAEEGWLYHFETAKDIAQYDHRLILVDFWAVWCGPCKKMDAEVWSDPDVRHQKRKFVPLKVDVDRDPAVASTYNVRAMPTLMILNSYGEILYQKVGFIDKFELNELLSSFPNNIASINQLHQQASDSQQNPYLNFMLASEYQKYGSVLEKEARRAFLSRSDAYFRQAVKNCRAENDTLLVEKTKLFQCLNDVLENKAKRSIKTIEKKIGLENISASNLPVAYYVLTNAYLQLEEKEQAQQYYRALTETIGGKYYQAALEEAFR